MHMTVAELIEKLAQAPQDATVARFDANFEPEPITDIRVDHTFVEGPWVILD
jgi:hypothetical protein